MSLKPTLPPLPINPVTDSAREVVRTLQAAGHEAYFVGGCVRDWLLRLEPYDVDVATSALPDQVTALFPNTRAVGAHFGVVLVVAPHAVIETATFRSDAEYLDFRRPTAVHFSSIKEDAERRDFTVNALYYDPISGKLVDFFSGALDLRRRILRAVGNARKRFEEDALRLIRAVRLAVKHDLQIEQNTHKAIIARAANLAEISRERVGEEMLRILTGPNPGRAMRLMSELGLWPYVIPEVESLKGCGQGAINHPEGDAFVHVALVLDHLPEDPPPALALAALLHDIAKPLTRTVDEHGVHFYGHQKIGAEMAREICRNLRYSSDLTDRVAELVDDHMRFMDVTKMKPVNLKRFVRQPFFQQLLDLHRADSLASGGELDAYHYCVEQRRQLAVEHGETLRPAQLANGDDLKALGLAPGPLFREILDELDEEQIEGRVRTRGEALDFLKARGAREPRAE